MMFDWLRKRAHDAILAGCSDALRELEGRDDHGAETAAIGLTAQLAHLREAGEDVPETSATRNRLKARNGNVSPVLSQKGGRMD